MSKWDVWLLGSNTYYSSNAESKVALSTMSTEGTIDEPLWVKLQIEAADPVFEEVDEESIGQYLKFNLQLEPFFFPDDYDKMELTSKVLRKPYLYLSFYKAADVTTNLFPWASKFHTSSQCLAVKRDSPSETNHSHEDAIAERIITLSLIKPLF